MDPFEIIGVLGFLSYVTAYAMLLAGHFDQEKAGYILLNLLAASLVLISLIDKFNLAALLVNLSWLGISLWGLRRMRYSGANNSESARYSAPMLSRTRDNNPVRGFLGDQFKLWSVRLAVKRERNALKKMDDRMLRDIGVHRVEADREALKALNDIPLKRLQHEHLMGSDECRSGVSDNWSGGAAGSGTLRG